MYVVLANLNVPLFIAKILVQCMSECVTINSGIYNIVIRHCWSNDKGDQFDLKRFNSHNPWTQNSGDSQ